MTYASHTTVSPGASREQIEKYLTRYGATSFGYMNRVGEAVIQFEVKGIPVRMRIPMPDKDADEFQFTPKGRRRRGKGAAELEWEKEVRRRWRSLCLVIKALLVAIDEGVFTFEEAFLSHIVWKGGLTTAERLLPAIEKAKQAGCLPTMDVKRLEAKPG